MATRKSMTKVVTEETVDSVADVETTVEKVEVKEKKEPRRFAQNDPILCYSVTPGWLGVDGKSGQYYTFEGLGDECEIEYQDLFALKSRRSAYLFSPYFVIADDDLLDDPRWKELKQFYDEKVYGKDDINEILNLPFTSFENTLKNLPKGLKKALCVQVAEKIEDGTFDSLKKIKAIDEVCGTDFHSILE